MDIQSGATETERMRYEYSDAEGLVGMKWVMMWGVFNSVRKIPLWVK